MLSEFKSNALPPLTFARVIAYEADQHALFVMLPSGQVLGTPVKVLINGPADQYRVRQHPLPLMGTWGVVAIPNQDVRAAVWLGSIYNTVADAITSHDPPIDLDTQMDYHSHISGHFELLDGAGNAFVQYADGSNVRACSDDKIPWTYRHVRNPDGTRKQLQTLPADRSSIQANPFYCSFHHSAGSTVTVDTLSDLFINQNNGASQTFTASGVTTQVPYGQYISLNQTILPSTTVGPASIVIGVSGTITSTVPTGQRNIITQAPQATSPPTSASFVLGDTGQITITTAQDQGLSSVVPTSSGSTGEGGQVNITGDGTFNFVDANGATFSTDNGANVLVIPGQTTTPAYGSVTLRNPNLAVASSIVIDAAGNITLTTPAGYILLPFLITDPIVVHSVGGGGGINLQGPAGSITANGNVLG